MRVFSMALPLLAVACQSGIAPNVSVPPSNPEPMAPAAPVPSSEAVVPETADADAKPPATLEDASEWTDLMPSQDLAGFQRVPIDPLAEKPVWQPSPDHSLLVIDGVGAKEMLLYDKELGDGVLHIEWRFRPATADNPIYNGGIYVRTPLDGKNWVQLQVAESDKPPVVGDLIAQLPSVAERVNVFQENPSPAHPVGEWNTYDISAKGKVIELSVNGTHTITWSECSMLTGHVGLQAEGAVIEVRSFKYKPL